MGTAELTLAKMSPRTTYIDLTCMIIYMKINEEPLGKWWPEGLLLRTRYQTKNVIKV